MSDNAHQQVREVFAQALDIDAPQRDAFVREACRGDAQRIAQVHALLAAYGQAGEFLASPTEATAIRTAARSASDAALSAERPGVLIGPYKILQLIGEGGFGSVFMAEQERPIRRRVALKIIKLGMDTRQVIARFEAERQALAMMDHPNIARVFDAGATESGRPYFVMELVRGEPITEYCDRNNLSMHQRLALFVPICQAVQHAHQKGIIHRDIKPSNVLVTLHDGVPVPKVIDFGIAKATSARLTEKTLFTEFRQFIGTPEYMSPEQAEMSGLDVDTRSDVYSLGVLLYELLTGTTPFDAQQLRSAALREIQRIIREVEPPRPSTRVSTLGATAHTIAAHRLTEPRKLSQIMRGDLDWIVMRCLEKDRTRRYETANGLARDIQRYIADEPVEATPPRISYRARKFLRRHRNPVIFATILALALILGLAATSVGLVIAKRERDRARIAQLAEKAARITADTQRKRADDQAEQLRQELYISQINRAQHLIDTGGSEPVKAILAVCDPQLRGWEWERLNWLADRSERTVEVHETPTPEVHATVSYSPDGRRFLTVGDYSKVRIWDSESFRMLLEIVDPQKREITYAAFSPDGSLLAVATNRGAVDVYDSTTGQRIREFKSEDPYVRVAAISPDNTRVVGGAWFGPTIMWDLKTGERVFSWDGNLARGEALQFTRDGRQLMVGSLGNDVAMIDLTTGKSILTERGAGFVVIDAALSPDESRIASIGQDSRLWVRDARTGRLIYSVATGKGAILALAFHPDNDFLAVVGSDGLITFFDSSNGEILGSLGGHEASITGVTFHPEGRWMLSMDIRGTVKRWHLGTRQALAMHRAHKTINCTQFSADNALIYFGPSEEGLKVFDARTLQQVAETSEPITVIADLRTSPDSAQTVVAWGDATTPVGHRLAALYDRAGSVLASWLCDGGIAGFSPDGSRIASLDEVGVVAIRDAATAEIQRRISVPEECAARMQFVDDHTLALSGTDGRVRVIDLRTGSTLRELQAHDNAFGMLSIHPLHNVMVTSAGDDALLVWEWTSGRLRHRITDAGQPTSLAISPDGRRLIAGGGAMSILLWDIETGRRIMTIGRTTGGIGTVAFSPDGRSVAASAGDHGLRIWETQPPTMIDLDRRYDVDVERRRTRRELLEIERES